MTNARPLLVALPLDHQTGDILAIAALLARRLEAPVVVVHAIPPRRLENDEGLAARSADARRQLEQHLTPLRAPGITLQEVVIQRGEPAEAVLTTALRRSAQMIISGGGRPSTVRRWVVGSVAEIIVRQSTVPVWIVRDGLPVGRPVLCPVDASPESKVGLEAAIRLARLLELPLRLLMVVAEESSRPSTTAPTSAYEQLEALIANYDVEGIEVSLTVSAGDPAQRIVDAADEAGLMIIGCKGYDPLLRERLGPVTDRALRFSHCNTLTIRHLSEKHYERMQAVTRLADLHEQAKALVADGRWAEALPLLEGLAEQAPTNAEVQETYAIALERAGKNVEATSQHELARLIRARLTTMP
ncbi:MAG: universal stress protein [Myxococcales bacterium]|nr:universal stress protein [Myxococcales bacterium]